MHVLAGSRLLPLQRFGELLAQLRNRLRLFSHRRIHHRIAGFCFSIFRAFFGRGRHKKTEWETSCSRSLIGNSSPVFYAKAVGGVKERLRCRAKQKNRSCRKYDTRAFTSCRGRLDVRTGTKPLPRGVPQVRVITSPRHTTTLSIVSARCVRGKVFFLPGR